MLGMLEAAVVTDGELTIGTVQPDGDPAGAAEIRDLLDRLGLGLDADIELFVTARRDGRLVGCLGLAGGVLKCAGCDEAAQGDGVLARVMERMNYEALDRGRGHLFAFTRPAKRAVFESLGFTFLAEVPDAVLLENTPFGLPRYLRALEDLALDGDRIGGIVLNANPFTLGHRYLVEYAASQVDALHVFVVSEDASFFPEHDRYHLVRTGVAELGMPERIRVHRGGRYVVSRATFPNYFIAGGEARARAAAGLDLQLFRDHIAPILGITDRFVGTEPLSPVTASYNAEMRHWLEEAPCAGPPIAVHEIPRRTSGPEVISASRVRALIEAHDLAAIEPLVPRPTFDHIAKTYFTPTDPRPDKE